jgi:hypothetical protein
MVVVGTNRQATIQATNAAEGVLSARAAVQAIGFAEVLGELNVVHGTDFHQRVHKAWLASPRALADEVAPLHAALAGALAHELGRALGARASGEVADLLQLVRRCVLRAGPGAPTPCAGGGTGGGDGRGGRGWAVASLSLSWQAARAQAAGPGSLRLAAGRRLGVGLGPTELQVGW